MVGLFPSPTWHNFGLKSWEARYQGTEARCAEGVNGVENGKRVSIPQLTKGLGERRELPQRGPGQSPGRN